MDIIDTTIPKNTTAYLVLKIPLNAEGLKVKASLEKGSFETLGAVLGSGEVIREFLVVDDDTGKTIVQDDEFAQRQKYATGQ